MTVALASFSLVVALVALALVRRQSRKLAQLTEMYWQLKLRPRRVEGRRDPGGAGTAAAHLGLRAARVAEAVQTLTGRPARTS